MIIKYLPGTNVEIPRSINSIRTLCHSLFLTGGLTLSQVSSLTNLSPQVLQNWVRRGFVPPPVNKRYSQSQFFRIAIINFLKDNLRIDIIVKLLRYTNINSPELPAEPIDDAALYQYFIEALILADNDLAKVEISIKSVLKMFKEPYPGAAKRLTAVIRILITYFISSQIKNSGDLLLHNIGLLNEEG